MSLLLRNERYRIVLSSIRTSYIPFNIKMKKVSVENACHICFTWHRNWRDAGRATPTNVILWAKLQGLWGIGKNLSRIIKFFTHHYGPKRNTNPPLEHNFSKKKFF